MKNKADSNIDELIAQIEKNQNDQKIAGHHGVPLLVYKDQVFFGQDKFNDLKKLLIDDGLLVK